MKRRLSWVLALLLVPVVLIAGPGAPSAVAATQSGPRADWSTTWNRYPTNAGKIKCAAGAHWEYDGFQQSVVTSMSCRPGSLVIGDQEWDVRLTYNGTAVDNGAATGTLCSMRSEWLDEQQLDTNVFYVTAVQGYALGDGELPGPGGTPAIVEQCDVSEVCYDFIDDENLLDDKEHHGCQAVTVGYPNVEPVEEPQPCAYGSPVYPEFVGDPYRVNVNTSYSYMARNMRFQFSAGTLASTKAWRAYAVVGTPGNPATFEVAPVVAISNSSTTLYPGYGKVSVSSPGVVAPQTILLQIPLGRHGPYSAQGTSTLPLDYDLVGVGLVYEGLVNLTYILDSPTRFPANPDRGMIGKTDVSLCSWYWSNGPYYVDAESTRDDTAGSVPPSSAPPPDGTDTPPPDIDPPAEDDGCDFSVTDPTSWLEGGMCVAAGLLGGILDALLDLLGAVKTLVTAVGGLVAGIVSGLLSGLVGLFVPSDGFLQGEVDDVKDAWTDTPPGEIVGTFTTLPSRFSTPTGSACGGLSVPLNFPMTTDTVDFRPFSTCEPWASNFATIVRTGLKAGIYLGVLIVCLRLLAASLGLQLNFGGGRDDDA